MTRGDNKLQAPSGEYKWAKPSNSVGRITAIITPTCQSTC